MSNELLGCHIPNRAVRPLLVVFPPPRFDHELRFLQGQKPVLVEAFIPKLAVEALDKGILHGLSRLNEVEMDPMLSRPRIQRRPGEFGPVIQDQGLWQWASENQPIENSTHPRPAKGDSDFNHRGFLRTGMRHRQTLVPSPRHQTVMCKIHRVIESGPGWPREGDARDRGRLSPASPAEGELLLSIIEALYLLMIHRLPFPSQPDINPRTAIAALALGHLADPRPQGGIVRASAAIPERVPIECQDAAHPPLTEPKARRDPLCARFALGPTSFLR